MSIQENTFTLISLSILTTCLVDDKLIQLGEITC